MTTIDKTHSIRRHRPFVLFWFARIFANVGLQMQVVAVGWQVYALTGSALDLGLVGLAQFLPSVALILFAGHVADRHDRRMIVRLCQTAQALCAATLAFGTWQGFLTRDIIFCVVFVMGAARAFEMPTTQALLPGLVPAELLPRAIAASASAMQAASIGGPALGGLLYAIAPAFVYSVCCALFFSASILIALIRIERVAAKREPVSAQMLFAGIAYIRQNPIILGAISLDMFAVLLGGATALLPIFARDVFQTEAWGLGVLRAAPAAGALVMAVALAHWPIGHRAGMKMFLGVTAFGIATMVFGLSQSFPLSLAALFVIGASDMVSVVVRQTLVQLNTPDAMRGRVAAVNSLFIGTSNQLGEFESGLLANFVGAKASVVLGGIGTLAIVGLWMTLFPQLRRVDRIDHRSG
jgi:MFS family permease